MAPALCQQRSLINHCNPAQFEPTAGYITRHENIFSKACSARNKTPLMITVVLKPLQLHLIKNETQPNSNYLTATKRDNSAHFFLEGPLTGGGCCEGPPLSTELPRRQLCSPATGEEESDWAASQTTWKPCGKWRDGQILQTGRLPGIVTDRQTLPDN